MEAGVTTKRSANVWKDTWGNIVVQLFVIHNAWTVEVALHPERAVVRLDFRAGTAKEVSHLLNVSYVSA